MRKWLIPLTLLVFVGNVSAQQGVTLTPQNLDLGKNISIPPAKACSLGGFFVGSAGAVISYQDSTKINAGGKVTVSIYASARNKDWENMTLVDSLTLKSGSTTAGICSPIQYVLPYAPYVAIRFSNSGSDTSWVKWVNVFIGRPALGANIRTLPEVLENLNGTAIAGTYVATAGNCTTRWYDARGFRYVTLWDAAVDTSTAGTTDSLDMVWVAQGSWKNSGSPFWPDSTGASTGVPTATTERVGHMFNTALPEVDTCYVQYPAFNCAGYQWIRFIGKSTTATNPQACKHWGWIKFEEE